MKIISFENHYNSFYPKFAELSDEEKLQYILDIEEGIFIEKNKKEDYNWILKNFDKENKNHPITPYIKYLAKRLI